MPRAFLQRSRLRLLTVAAWSGLRPAPASRFRGAHPHLPRSCTTPVYLMLPPFCVSLQHTEAKDAVVVLTDKSFHEALPLIGRLRAEHRVHRQPPDACDAALAFRFAFAQPDTGKRGGSVNTQYGTSRSRVL